MVEIVNQEGAERAEAAPANGREAEPVAAAPETSSAVERAPAAEPSVEDGNAPPTVEGASVGSADRPVAGVDVAATPSAGAGQDGTQTEAPEASTASKEKDDAPDEAPKFRPQHEEEVAPDDKRPIGWSEPVKEPSEASKNPDAAFLMGSRMTTAFEGHPGVEPFTGKRMVIKLGLGSKYVFDGDKVPKALRHGRGGVRGEDAPIDIVVGNVKDVNNKRQADKKNQMLSDDRAMDIQAMSLQAAAVMKAREEGSKDPVPASDVVKGRFGEGAGIIAERIEALSPEDLKIMSESRIRDLSHAAQRMMVYGVPTKDLGRASEMVTRIEEGAPEIAGDPKDGQEPKAAPAMETTSPEAGTAPPEAEPGAAETGSPTPETVPVASEPVVSEPVASKVADQGVAPAANDPVIAANDDRVTSPAQDGGADRQAGATQGVQPDAAATVQEAPVRERQGSIMDQARAVTANDATSIVRPNGPDAANDASAALLAAAARNAKSRD